MAINWDAVVTPGGAYSSLSASTQGYWRAVASGTVPEYMLDAATLAWKQSVNASSVADTTSILTTDTGPETASSGNALAPLPVSGAQNGMKAPESIDVSPVPALAVAGAFLLAAFLAYKYL
jgi:hypothetical protein